MVLEERIDGRREEVSLSYLYPTVLRKRKELQMFM